MDRADEDEVAVDGGGEEVGCTAGGRWGMPSPGEVERYPAQEEEGLCQDGEISG